MKVCDRGEIVYMAGSASEKPLQWLRAEHAWFVRHIGAICTEAVIQAVSSEARP